MPEYPLKFTTRVVRANPDPMPELSPDEWAAIQRAVDARLQRLCEAHLAAALGPPLPKLAPTPVVEPPSDPPMLTTSWQLGLGMSYRTTLPSAFMALGGGL